MFIRVISVGVAALPVCEDPEQIGEQQAAGGGFIYLGKTHKNTQSFEMEKSNGLKWTL